MHMIFDIGHFDNLRQQVKDLSMPGVGEGHQLTRHLQVILRRLVDGQERLYHQLFHQIIDNKITDAVGRVSFHAEDE